MQAPRVARPFFFGFCAICCVPRRVFVAWLGRWSPSSVTPSSPAHAARGGFLAPAREPARAVPDGIRRFSRAAPGSAGEIRGAPVCSSSAKLRG
jgi:hypothetical protein